MRIKLELEIPSEFLSQVQERANYLNERYDTGTMIKARDVIRELLYSKSVESVVFPEFEKKVSSKNLDIYKEFFD